LSEQILRIVSGASAGAAAVEGTIGSFAVVMSGQNDNANGRSIPTRLLVFPGNSAYVKLDEIEVGILLDASRRLSAFRE
jgi:hypothetical protein